MFGRKKRANVGTYVAPRITPLAPIERVVDEGALIFVSSARMALMNHIIVDALGEHVDYDPESLRGVVRAELHRLATDNDATAARLEATDPVKSELDTREDFAQQKREDQSRRPAVHRMIADALRRCAESDERVDELLTEARTDAVDAMFRAIHARLSATTFATDENYASERARRISAFVHIDLLGKEPPVTGDRG
jgi:hypothetical protein